MFNFIIQLFAFFGVAFILALIITLVIFKMQDLKEKRNNGKNKTETRTIKDDILEAWNSDPQRKSDNDGKNDAEFISAEITKFYKVTTKENQKSCFIESIDIKSDSAASQIMVMTIKIKSHCDNNDDKIIETKNRFIDVLKSYVFDINDKRLVNKNNGLESFCDNLHANLFGSLKTQYAQDLQNGIYSIEACLPKDDSDYIFTIRFSTAYTDENQKNPPMGRYYFGCKVGNQILVERLINDLNECLINCKRHVDISDDLLSIRQYVERYINPWHYHKRNNSKR